jgi:prevent-host-death family protein
MRSVNVADLKNRLSYYLSEVRAGGEILVRDRNTPIAKIIPITDGCEADHELRALAAQGKVRLPEIVLDESFWDLPAPRVAPAVLKRVMEDERSED